jgi:hypothetical protein
VYREGGSPDRRAMILREVLANLACKLHRLVVHNWAWLSSCSCGHGSTIGTMVVCQPSCRPVRCGLYYGLRHRLLIS